jgi:hypothetical protein
MQASSRYPAAQTNTVSLHRRISISQYKTTEPIQDDISGLINEEGRLPSTPRSPQLSYGSRNAADQTGRGRPASRVIHGP